MARKTRQIQLNIPDLADGTKPIRKGRERLSSQARGLIRKHGAWRHGQILHVALVYRNGNADIEPIFLALAEWPNLHLTLIPQENTLNPLVEHEHRKPPFDLLMVDLKCDGALDIPQEERGGFNTLPVFWIGQGEVPNGTQGELRPPLRRMPDPENMWGNEGAILYFVYELSIALSNIQK